MKCEHCGEAVDLLTHKNQHTYLTPTFRGNHLDNTGQRETCSALHLVFWLITSRNVKREDVIKFLKETEPK